MFGKIKTTADNTEETLMPFRIAEVVEMSRILRDVVLGLITFMFPDIKMFNANGVRQKQWHTLCQVICLFFYYSIFYYFFIYNSNEFDAVVLILQ